MNTTKTVERYTRPTASQILDAARDYLENGAPAKSHTSMSFGVMPEREDFDAAFAAYCPDGTFSFGNDERVGYDDLDADDLWNEIESALEEHDTSDDQEDGGEADRAGSWCSSVLGILGFEWI